MLKAVSAPASSGSVAEPALVSSPSALEPGGPGCSSPPLRISEGLALMLQNSTQETVVEPGWSRGWSPGWRSPGATAPPSAGGFIWSEPAILHWEPSLGAVEAVFDAVNRPQSCCPPARLRLVENWMGQAELAVQPGAATPSPLPGPAELPHVLWQLPSQLCSDHDDTFVSSPPESLPSSPDRLAHDLKRRATSLFPQAKRRRHESASSRGSPQSDAVLNTDALFANSALDLSESSLHDFAHLEATTLASDTAESLESSAGSAVSAGSAGSDGSADSAASDGSADSAASDGSADSAASDGSADSAASADSVHSASSSEGEAYSSPPSPQNKDAARRIARRIIKRARRHKLGADEIKSIVDSSARRAINEPLGLLPVTRALDGAFSRAHMLRRMHSTCDLLAGRARGRLRCGDGCSADFTSALAFAEHLDAAHAVDPRPVKCPYIHCAWWVLGFPTKAQCLRHIRQRHTTIVHECTICKRLRAKRYKFARADALQRHLVHIHGKQETRGGAQH